MKGFLFKNILYYCICLYLFSNAEILYAQTDWQKWEAKQVSYELPAKAVVQMQNKNTSLTGTLLNSLKSAYSLIISDYDGDNCPFSPSCADFFVKAVEETNLLSGTLMFADRFTRDMNLFKNSDHYFLHKNGKYFDPPGNYTLNLQKIKFKLESD